MRHAYICYGVSLLWSGTSMILDSKWTSSSDMQLLRMPQEARIRKHIGQTTGFIQNGPY